MTWDDVARIGLELPGVEVGSAYGTPALRVRGSFMCRVREDGETLAIRCDPAERPFLIEAHEGRALRDAALRSLADGARRAPAGR